MRIIGRCPKCQSKDTIISSFGEAVYCEKCKSQWPKWLNLLFIQERAGEKMIPVNITNEPRYVSLELPYEVPWLDLVNERLWQLITSHFQLKPIDKKPRWIDNEIDEGEWFKGRSKQGIMLKKLPDRPGLFDNSDRSQAEINGFCVKILRALYEKSVVINNRDFGWAPLLRLEETPANRPEAELILETVISQVLAGNS